MSEEKGCHKWTTRESWGNLAEIEVVFQNSVSTETQFWAKSLAKGKGSI